MKFDELDDRMRVFEAAHDLCVLPGLWMVARLDGRGFTRLTKEVHQFEAPFDPKFRDMMLDTVEHLLNCGFNVICGYTESDEISLLLSQDEDRYSRKLRKLISILAGEASAKFSLLLGDVACFDCRVSQLPSVDLVIDYFRWRSEDAHRNALNSHCYWCLRKDGKSVAEATAAVKGLTTAEKNELLFQHGINYNDLPRWQKRGSGLYWEEYEREAENPRTGRKVLARRRRIRRELELPMKAAERMNGNQAHPASGAGIGDILYRYENRCEAIGKFVEAYRHYCWPVQSLDDLKLAPFHLLATEGKVHTDQNHLWHMEMLAGVCHHDSCLLLPTPYKLIDLADPESEEEGTQWWLQLTEQGGEGMVVKPQEFVVSGTKGLVQPAVKCRGPEYLRIIYGPEYTFPENLNRLRERGLATKRSLALREFALGIEALERFARREPLRRVHECVFGVLALESEPVDPRL